MVFVDSIAGNEKEKKSFMSFLSRFTGSGRKMKAGKNDDKPNKKNETSSNEPRPGKMTLKLSTPSNPQTEDPPQLLTDILMNEQLFEVFHGKSLILQAEVKVEKQLDGSPKSMIVSGQVPVTLAKGFRNGKPTREIRVRGHLRRKQSNELTTPGIASLSSADQLGFKHSKVWEDEDKYRTDRKKKQHWRRKLLRDPPLSPLEQAEFQTSSPIRTYSKLGLSRLEKKCDLSPWSGGEAGYIDQIQRFSSENELQDNPTGIANWSPYFDCGSPMSDPQFNASWDLREKTPTPRFSPSRTRGCNADKREKSSNEWNSTNKTGEGGDWTPFIGVTSSTSNQNISKKAELSKNKEHENQKWNPQVNQCTLVEGCLSKSGVGKEESKDIDHFGLCVARSESVVDGLREGQLDSCLKEDSVSNYSVKNFNVASNPHLHEDATQTTPPNERRRKEISKISHQVGQKLSHLKEIVMKPKSKSENATGVVKENEKDRKETEHLNPLGEEKYHIGGEGILPAYLKNQKNAEDKTERRKSPKDASPDQCYTCESHGNDAFRHWVDQEMYKKLLRARENAVDKHVQTTTASEEEQGENYALGSSKKTLGQSKMVQARERSIDQYMQGKKNKIVKGLRELGVGEMGAFSPSKSTRKLEPPEYKSTPGGEAEKNWSDGSYAREKFSERQKKQNLYDPNHEFMYTRVDTAHNDAGGNRMTTAHDGADSKDESTVNRTNDHGSERSGENTGNKKYARETGDFPGIYGYAADKLNSTSDIPRVTNANMVSPARDSSGAKKLNPIMAITISRSRTKFFRYDNGVEYKEKEGTQILTVEAPKGLFYSSDQSLNYFKTPSKEKLNATR